MQYYHTNSKKHVTSVSWTNASIYRGFYEIFLLNKTKFKLTVQALHCTMLEPYRTCMAHTVKKIKFQSENLNE